MKVGETIARLRIDHAMDKSGFEVSKDDSDLMREALHEFVEFESKVYAFQLFSKVTGWNNRDFYQNQEHLPEIIAGIEELAVQIRTIEIERDRQEAISQVMQKAESMFRKFVPGALPPENDEDEEEFIEVEVEDV